MKVFYAHFGEMFRNAIVDTSLVVRLEAINGVSALLQNSPEFFNFFQPALPHIIDVCHFYINIFQIL